MFTGARFWYHWLVTRPMDRLNLELAGVGVELAGPGPVLSELRRDFAWFATDAPRPEPIRLELSEGGGEPAPAGPASLRWRDFRAFDEGPVRRIFYRDGARASYDYRRREGVLRAAGPDRLRELAYLAVLSRAGDALDRRGLHRVHALTVASRGEAALVVLPCGGGKSSLALELLRRSSVSVLGEDTALLGADRIVRAFPLRWGFRDRGALGDVPEAWVRPFRRTGMPTKWVVDLPFYRDRIVEEAPLRRLFFGARTAGPAGARPLGAEEAFARLLAPAVLGVGLAQLTEYCLRRGELAGLAGVAASRARLAWSAARTAAPFALTMGRSPAEAVDALLQALDEPAPAALLAA